MDYELDDRPYHEDEMNRELENPIKMLDKVENMLIDEVDHEVMAK
jgi:hypothetical protein